VTYFLKLDLVPACTDYPQEVPGGEPDYISIQIVQIYFGGGGASLNLCCLAISIWCSADIKLYVRGHQWPQI